MLPEGAELAPAPDSAQLLRLQKRGLPFGPGESLEFSVDYGLIHAGTAILSVEKMRDYRGRPCYHFVSEARSAKMFDGIYKVRDRIDAIVDSEKFVTWQYRKVQREGGYTADHRAIYDHSIQKAKYADGEIVDFPKGSLDALSAFYFARLQDFEKGGTFFIPHHSDKKTYYLKVICHGRERVEVPAGTFDCWVIEPLVKDSGPFKGEGRMKIWLTADQNKMPVMMKSKIGPGSVTATLTRITYGRPVMFAADTSNSSP
jgi:hypothetical protein